MYSSHRTVLIAGAAGGIGAATARALSARGDHLFLLDRRKDAVEALETELPNATGLTMDLADSALPPSVRERIEIESGRLDAFVNASGIVASAGDGPEDGDDVGRILDINLTAAVRLTLELVPLLARADSGRVVHVGSVQAERAGRSSVGYAASKGGLHAATRALAVDLAAHGILVNAVSPGFVDTPMARLADGRTEYETEWFRSVFVRHAGIPLHRPGTATEVAAVIALLLAPENTYMTGSVLTVDGGLSAAL